MYYSSLNNLFYYSFKITPLKIMVLGSRDYNKKWNNDHTSIEGIRDKLDFQCYASLA
jgi:hypothetical protein